MLSSPRYARMVCAGSARGLRAFLHSKRAMAHQRVTGKHRTKRVDSRPNAKQRLRQLQREEARKTAADLRVVTIRGRDRKERKVPSLSPEESSQSTSVLSDDDRMIRNLRKKLRNIDELIERRKRGETLNALQIAKIDQLDTTVAAFEELLKKKHGASASPRES